jgi:hypothetical protein
MTVEVGRVELDSFHGIVVDGVVVPFDEAEGKE